MISLIGFQCSTSPSLNNHTLVLPDKFEPKMLKFEKMGD